MIHVFDHPLGFREPIPAGDDEVPVFSFGANMSRASLRSRGVAVSDKEPVKAVVNIFYHSPSECNRVSDPGRLRVGLQFSASPHGSL